MEAILFDGKTGSLKYENQHPIPKIVADNEVIVKIAYSGVCGTDLHIIQGEFPIPKDKPIILGHEFSGIVHEVGKDCSLTKGQKVVVDPNSACNLCHFCRIGKYQFCQRADITRPIGTWSDGGWATYFKVKQDQVYLLPNDVSLEQGAVCEPYSCVSQGYKLASPIQIGERILVVGAGIIGNLWITTLHNQGHKHVTVSELNKTRLDIVKKLETGYRLITPDILEKENQYYDLIIDCTGVGKVMEICFNYLNHGGKYVLFGCCPPTHKTTITPFQVFDKGLSIIGVRINPFSFPTAIGWLSSLGDRYFNYEKLGIRIYKLNDYKKALEDLKSGVVSKAVFKLN